MLLGAVELEKLPLKKDALKKLNLPIEVKSGFIGKLKIEIPFRRLKSQPWVVQVDQLYLIAGPSVAPAVSVHMLKSSTPRILQKSFTLLNL